MTDRLRELFDDMLSGEPPLQTTSADTEAAGKRLRRQRQTLWTVVAAVLAVALIAVAPVLAGRSRPGAGAGSPAVASATLTVTPGPATPAPTSAPTALVSRTAPAAAGVQLSPSPYCPASPIGYTADQTDGSVLPAPDRAVAAVKVAAQAIVPRLQFILRYDALIPPSAKMPGIPQLAIIFDVGDDDGFGSINFQILPEVGPSPSLRAKASLSRLDQCEPVQRETFRDGSVALYYPYGPSIQEREVTHVWYYAARGFTMNIGAFSQGWSSSDDPNKAAPPPALPIRGNSR